MIGSRAAGRFGAHSREAAKERQLLRAQGVYFPSKELLPGVNLDRPDALQDLLHETYTRICSGQAPGEGRDNDVEDCSLDREAEDKNLQGGQQTTVSRPFMLTPNPTAAETPS